MTEPHLDRMPPGAPRGRLGLVVRTLVRLALFAFAIVLWQIVGTIVEDWMARKPLSGSPLPGRGRSVPLGHPVRWGAHHHLGYAVMLLSLGLVALVASLGALASLGRDTVDGWLGGLRRRVARETAYRTDGPPRPMGRFQSPILPEASPAPPDDADPDPSDGGL